MIKRRIVPTLLIAGIMSIPAPASANHGEPIYRIRFYSDATYAQQVGEDLGYCIYYGAAYTHSGQSTQYPLYEHIGYCAEGGEYEPI
jgi:hypothetical protein